MKCPYLLYTHKPKSETKYKCIIGDVYTLSHEEISKYCNVEGESAYLTCPRFLQKLRSK